MKRDVEPLTAFARRERPKLASPRQAAFEAALQLCLALGPILALLVAISVGGATSGRAGPFRAGAGDRHESGRQRSGKQQRRRSNRYGPAANQRAGSWPADVAARCRGFGKWPAVVLRPKA